MGTYIIGDVHACLTTLHRLLEAFRYDESADRILMTGDLVNGGPDSAGVVRWAMNHGAEVVLGNHDLHLLAVAAGARPPRKNDTFLELLGAEDSDELLNWLRNLPLAIHEENLLLVHAGVFPSWDIPTVMRLAGEVEEQLRDGSRLEFWRGMYGNEPPHWDENLRGGDRLRVVVNAMTRLRTLTADHEINADYTGPLRDVPPNLQPWFAIPGRRSSTTRIFFGHWAALGFYQGENVVGLDSGCAWGGDLTAWRLEDGEVFQVPSELKK